MNPFKAHTSNPGSEEEKISSHEGLWKAVTGIRIRQAVTDERVRYNTWALGLLVGLHVATLGLVMGVLL